MNDIVDVLLEGGAVDAAKELCSRANVRLVGGDLLGVGS